MREDLTSLQTLKQNNLISRFRHKYYSKPFCLIQEIRIIRDKVKQTWTNNTFRELRISEKSEEPTVIKRSSRLGKMLQEVKVNEYE